MRNARRLLLLFVTVTVNLGLSARWIMTLLVCSRTSIAPAIAGEVLFCLNCVMFVSLL